MFGSYKVNGTVVEREISAAQALPGYLYVVKTPPGCQTKAGDLVLKTKDGSYVRLHENPAVLSWRETANQIVVAYVDIEIKYEKSK